MEYKDGLHKYNIFVSLHRIQLESSGVPEKFWPALFKKLENQTIDAGNSFSIFKIDYEENEKSYEDPVYTVLVTKENGISCDDGSEIYLIDHAWTYEVNKAFSNLMQIPGLADRMCNILGISIEKTMEEKVESICREMWKCNQTYSYGFGSAEHRVPMWYIMDELGSAIEHSDEPNFRTVPFYHFFDQCTYSLLFPVKNVDYNEKVTRDFLEGLYSDNDLLRKALLIPWRPSSFLDVDFNSTEPNENYFLSQHLNEILPVKQQHFSHDMTKVIKVYSEYDMVNNYLTHPSFLILEYEDRDRADILWLKSHFKDFKRLSEESPHKFINQFPYETVLTIKNLFSAVCQRKKTKNQDQFDDNPVWHPVTYDLQSDLVKFVSYYQNRDKANLSNFWICKPWNLARGLDTIITDNLNCILRLPSSGPKIAQKYIFNPVLFNRCDVGLVKFDVRYVLLLKSVQPLCLYAYKNFFLRFANKPYDLTNFWNNEKHFTVMNYSEETPLFKMLCDEFIVKFSEQNPECSWKEIETKIFKAFKEMFEAATLKPPPAGIGANTQSRALYAVDLLLAREKTTDGSSIVQPKVLEVNWMPDCQRACEYYPDFFNDVFLLLFKDMHNKSLFELL